MLQQPTQHHPQVPQEILLVKHPLLKDLNLEQVPILLLIQLPNPHQINIPMELQQLNHHHKVVVPQLFKAQLDLPHLKLTLIQSLAEHQQEINNHQPQLAQLLPLLAIKLLNLTHLFPQEHKELLQDKLQMLLLDQVLAQALPPIKDLVHHHQQVLAQLLLKVLQDQLLMLMQVLLHKLLVEA